MWGHPGKKLLFMGGEFAQEREWNHDRELDWRSLDDPAHAGVQRLVRDLNRLYAARAALHQRDCDPSGFRWVVGDDAPIPCSPSCAWRAGRSRRCWSSAI